MPDPSPRQPDQETATGGDEAVSDSLTGGVATSDQAEPMNENTLRQAAAAIDIFGQEVVGVSQNLLDSVVDIHHDDLLTHNLSMHL